MTSFGLTPKKRLFKAETVLPTGRARPRPHSSFSASPGLLIGDTGAAERRTPLPPLYVLRCSPPPSHMARGHAAHFSDNLSSERTGHEEDVDPRCSRACLPLPHCAPPEGREGGRLIPPGSFSEKRFQSETYAVCSAVNFSIFVNCGKER